MSAQELNALASNPLHNVVILVNCKTGLPLMNFLILQNNARTNRIIAEIYK